MKKSFSILLLVVCAIQLVAAAEPDSKAGTTRVRLSRDSQVGTVVIPAGDYKVKLQQHPGGPTVLRLTSEAGKTIELSVSEEQSTKQSSAGQAYNFFGNTRVLSKIWFKGESKVYHISDTAVASKE